MSFANDTIICKRYETTDGGYVLVEFKLHFRILYLWGFVTQRRIVRPYNDGEIENLPWHRSIIYMSGVGYFPLEEA